MYEAQKRWRKKHPKRVKEIDRRKLLKHRYNITPEQYDILLESQDGKCAICGGGPVGRNRLSVDHDHKTGRVRGLLCQNCNMILGNSHDDTNKLQRAIEYLNR